MNATAHHHTGPAPQGLHNCAAAGPATGRWPDKDWLLGAIRMTGRGSPTGQACTRDIHKTSQESQTRVRSSAARGRRAAVLACATRAATLPMVVEGVVVGSN